MQPQLSTLLSRSKRSKPALRGADIIVTATTSREPVLERKWISRAHTSTPSGLLAKAAAQRDSSIANQVSWYLFRRGFAGYGRRSVPLPNPQDVLGSDSASFAGAIQIILPLVQSRFPDCHDNAGLWLVDPRALGEKVPMALMCAPGEIHFRSSTGSLDVVAVTMMSAPRKAASTVSTGSTRSRELGLHFVCEPLRIFKVPAGDSHSPEPPHAVHRD